MADPIASLNLLIRASAESLAADINRGLRGAQGAVGAQSVALGVLIANGIAAGVSKIGSTITSTISESLKLAASFETTTTNFKVLLGDLGKANQMISGMRVLDQSSPLKFSDLTGGAEALLSMGVSAENILPDLKTLGEISLGSSERMGRLVYAFGQISSLGRMAGTELRQLTELGFNPLEFISKRTGESMAKLTERMSEGKISFEEFKLAAIDATTGDGRFAGGMEAASKTVDGIMAKLEGTIAMLKVDLGTGINEALKEPLKGMAEELSRIGPLIKQIGKDIGEWIAKTIEAQGGIKGIANSVIDFAAAIANAYQGLEVLFAYLKTGFQTYDALFRTLGAAIVAQMVIVTDAFDVVKKLIEGLPSLAEFAFKSVTADIADAILSSMNSLKNSTLKVMNDLQTEAIVAAAEIAKYLNPKEAPAFDLGIKYAREGQAKYNPASIVPDLPTGAALGGPRSLLFPGDTFTEEAASAANISAEVYESIEKMKATSADALQSIYDVANTEFSEAEAAAAKANGLIVDFTSKDTYGDKLKENLTQKKATSAAIIQDSVTTNAALVNQEIAKAGQVAEIASKEADAKIKTADDAADRIQQANIQTYDSFREIGQRTIGDMVTAWATGTGKISDIVSQWANNMIQQFIQVSLFGNKSGGGDISGLLSGLSGMGTGGGLFGGIGSIIGGFFASGGRPPMGKVSVVGERGPELFVPDSAGRIIPNSRMASFAPAAAGGGGEMASPIIINQTFQSGVGRAELAGMMDDMMDQTKGAVAEGVRRGGSFRRSVQS